MSADQPASDSGSGKSVTAPDSPYAVLRNRNYVLYLVGRSIASFGQQMLTVAVGWELYERTHSAMALGIVGLTQMIPMLVFTLPAGHLADTANRKHIIMAMTLVTVVASLGLTLTALFETHVFWIYASLFIAGAARTFMWPSSSAFLPQLVPREQFAKAVTWNSGSFHLSSVAGPAIGGAVLAVTKKASVIFGFNTFAVLTCFTLISFIRYQRNETQREPMTLHRLLAGFHFVFENRVILGIITLDLFAVLLGGATSLLPVYAKDILHAGPSGLGLLQAALPAGSFLCALILAHRPPMEKAGRALLWSVAGFGLATVIFGFSQVFWLSFAMLFVCGATDNISVVVRHTLVQLLTPDEKRGRVSAVNSLFIGTSNELGGFESGSVAQLFGPVASVVSGGIGTILVVVAIAWFWPEIRRYGRLGGPGV
jgi:MFS family permease